MSPLTSGTLQWLTLEKKKKKKNNASEKDNEVFVGEMQGREVILFGGKKKNSERLPQ